MTDENELHGSTELRALFVSAITDALLFEKKIASLGPLDERALGVKVTPQVLGVMHAIENVADLATSSSEVKAYLAAHIIDVDPDELTSRRLLKGAAELTRLIIEDPLNLPDMLYDALYEHFERALDDAEVYEVPFGALTATIRHECREPCIDIGRVKGEVIRSTFKIDATPMGLGLDPKEWILDDENENASRLIEVIVNCGTELWKCPFCGSKHRLTWADSSPPPTTEGTECSHSPEK